MWENITLLLKWDMFPLFTSHSQRHVSSSKDSFYCKSKPTLDAVGQVKTTKNNAHKLKNNLSEQYWSSVLSL